MKQEKRSPVLLFVLFIGLVSPLLFVLGCGKSGPVGPDYDAQELSASQSPAVIKTVQGFMDCLAKGNHVEAQRYLSATVLQDHPELTISALTFTDFGDDIHNPAGHDVVTYVFTVDHVAFTSANVAELQAHHATGRGTIVTMNFDLIWDNGQWYIDFLTVFEF